MGRSSDPVAALPDRSRLVWWGLAFVIAALLVMVLRRFLGVVAFGTFLYYVGRPVSRRLEPRVGSRSRAASLTLVTILLPFVVVLGAVTAVTVAQVLALTDDELDTVVESVSPYVDPDSLPETPREAYAMVLEYVRLEDAAQLFDQAIGVAGTLTVLTIELTLLFTLVVLLLRGDRAVATWFRETVAGPDTVGYEYLAAVDRDLGRIYVGQMVTMFAVVVLAWVRYTALGFFAPRGLSLPYPLLLAMLTGVASFVPIVGRSLVYVPIGLFFAVQALRTNPILLWYAAFAMLSGWFGLDPAIRYGVRPYLTSHSVSPGLMIVAYITSAALFGWYGVFLAPVLLVGTVQFLEHVFPALIHGQPITDTPTATSDESDAETALADATGESETADE